LGGGGSNWWREVLLYIYILLIRGDVVVGSCMDGVGMIGWAWSYFHRLESFHVMPLILVRSILSIYICIPDDLQASSFYD
jgi:uncharacterized membrane protein